MIDVHRLREAMGLDAGADSTCDRRHLAHHDRVTLVGCAMEISRPRPSFPELAAALGTGHSTVMGLWREWLSWHWRIRHGWLQHAERSLLQIKDGVAA